MTALRTFAIATRALRRNVTRSALTILGIVIGIAAVIIMMEIGKGSSGAIRKTIESMGANNLLIMPGTASSGGVTFGAGSTLTMTAEDAAAIERECDAVVGAAPVMRVRSQVVYQERNWVPSFIYGTTPRYLDVRGWTNMADGDMFTDADVRNAGRVCVVGKTIVRELFQGLSPVGKEVRIQNVGMKVVGVLSSKGANTFGMDQDDVIIAPWTTVKYRITSSSAGANSQPANSSASTQASGTSGGTAGSKNVYPGAAGLYPVPSAQQQQNMPVTVRFANIDQIQVSARAGRSKEAIEQITAVLRERHHLRADDPNDFSIRDMSEMAAGLQSTTAMMTNLLLSVALISLVVGGVGIMNIMLVSVTERTKEIGLRMAVGARGKDILTQFLLEATVLCLAGGIIGLALGRGGGMLVKRVMKWPIEPSMEAIVASIAVSAMVGIVFGFYPAWKASRMDPIEALRYE
ncbi:MAG TPA: ABC transporter permease [Phycisphaerales bacterium]|nr:ABC transporter permease [Phycisphaerales bacterium]